MSKKIDEIYDQKCQVYSDIVEHLPVLKLYANEVDHVTEMGVRTVVSTYAFLAGRPKRMISYDIIPVEQFGVDRFWLAQIAAEVGTVYEFRVGDTTQVDIEETDLLFIDTLHTYEQLKIELARHAHKVRQYMIFHDIAIFGNVDETGTGWGLVPAIQEFLAEHPEWFVHEWRMNNNGLGVLKHQNTIIKNN